MRLRRPASRRRHGVGSFPSWRTLMAALLGALMLVGGGTGAGSAFAQSVDASGTDLAAAVRARQAAEARLAELTVQFDRIVSEVGSRFAGADQLAAEIELARQQMRRSAVDAFVNADAEDRLVGLLSGDDLAEASNRATFTAELTLDWSEALAAFEAIKRDNDPALIELVERKERIGARLADATDAVFQARATEADAERALAAAELEAQRRPVAARSGAASTPATAAPVAVAGSPRAPESPRRSDIAAEPTAPPTTRAPAAPVMPSTDYSAPLPDLPSAGPTEDQWRALRVCESGGNYQIVSASGRYRGAYQFDVSTWASMGGTGDPAAAPPAEQDARAKLLYAERGARAWPHCGRAFS